MNRRLFLSSVALAPAALTSPLAHAAQAPKPSGSAPSTQSVTFDAMGELRMEYSAALIRDMLASGLNAITITLCDPKPEGDEALALALDELLAQNRWLAANAQFFVKATSVTDIGRAQREGKLAVFYLFQNSVQFGSTLDVARLRIELFHRLGLRSSQLTYNAKNPVASGCDVTGGLSEMGRGVVAHMNERRLLIDLSHANLTTMRDAIAASKTPVVISHTACATIHPHRRNTDDGTLRLLADRGGVVGICQMRPFLTTKKTDNLDAYFDHLLHAIQVAGIEHVGIGSDRDHRVTSMTPEYLAELKREEGAQVRDNELPYFIAQLNGPRRMEVVREGLRKRGLGAGDLDKVMGGNVYRLYQDVIG